MLFLMAKPSNEQRLNQAQAQKWLNSCCGERTIKAFAEEVGVKPSRMMNFMYGQRPITAEFLGYMKRAGYTDFFRTEVVFIVDTQWKPTAKSLRKPTGRPDGAKDSGPRKKRAPKMAVAA